MVQSLVMSQEVETRFTPDNESFASVQEVDSVKSLKSSVTSSMVASIMQKDEVLSQRSEPSNQTKEEKLADAVRLIPEFKPHVATMKSQSRNAQSYHTKQKRLFNRGQAQKRLFNKGQALIEKQIALGVLPKEVEDNISLSTVSNSDAVSTAPGFERPPTSAEKWLNMM